MGLLPIFCSIFSFLLNMRLKLIRIPNNLSLKGESLPYWYTPLKRKYSKPPVTKTNSTLIPLMGLSKKKIYRRDKQHQ